MGLFSNRPPLEIYNDPFELEPSLHLLIDYRMSGFNGQIAVQIQKDAVLGDEVVRQELSLALDEHETSLLESETVRLQYPSRLVSNLQFFFFFF